jgi:hypothetical protein
MSRTRRTRKAARNKGKDKAKKKNPFTPRRRGKVEATGKIVEHECKSPDCFNTCMGPCDIKEVMCGWCVQRMLWRYNHEQETRRNEAKKDKH